ncbi:hypothetical protein ERO13_A11G045800v2 [Gossypium hirsutum]|uniref:Transcription factor HHO5 n=2 Tax=Gossypium TaxID=3633 RepID=A0ABM2Z1M5_GOSHI|nr:transcription factor HHO5-like [Gossypium hirsutum]KAG4173226.1 hypothetical protein ERO13_A11G045800v2 [Gossypium hirsutum]TYH99261.1 hypothetical protein ES332_A11G055000v1 [Gossypium tomentosum]
MEFSLDLSSVFVPKTITEFLKEASKIKDGFQRSSKISDYVKRLEDEMKKIDGFKRELPLCMLLLKDGIERLKVEEMQCKETDDGLPLKENDDGDKTNWLSSVQLWNSDFNIVDHNKKPNTVSELKLRSGREEEEEDMSENPIKVCNNKSRGGAFVPFKDISGIRLMNPSFELVSCNGILRNNGGCTIGSGSSLTAEKTQIKFQTESQDQQKLQQNSRKQRRCWSPELHRLFVDALQQLGGSQVATPKQIKEVMQVDDLTNDEVKSHLQKYRLHIRKLPPSSTRNQCSENMKSQSGSPQCPLTVSALAKGMSSTGGDSMDGEEDEKSDGLSWRSGVHKPGEIECIVR